MTVQDQPLLITLVAVQFIVHALGWAMATRLSRGWHEPQGQFALSWATLAAGLLLYVPAWPSGHAMRNLGDLLIIGALVLQHRGLARFWGQAAGDRALAALLLLAAGVIGFSLYHERGHAWRVATVCVGTALPMLASARLVWRQGRVETPVFARAMAAAYTLLAMVLLARAAQVLQHSGPSKVSLDAPGRTTLALVILVLFVGGAINLAQVRLTLGRVLLRLRAQAQSDALTGTANRRGLLQGLRTMHLQARAGGHGYAVLMVDADHFKAINDLHGHAVGDRVLKHIAQVLREGLRAGDLVARWGGEEFCVLLPHTALCAARALAERLALQIASGGEPPVTVSIGVAEALAASEGTEDVIRRADAALYRAKQAGRNRVEVSPRPASA